MKIVVFGTGYVGLTQAAALAEIGHQVTGVDVNEVKVDSLRRGQLLFYEPDLEPLVRRNQALGRLSFTTDFQTALPDAEIIFIAVGTPAKIDGSADLDAVNAVAATIGAAIVKPSVIVVKSTVPVGTADHIASIIETGLAARGLKLFFDVASNPEFLKEGSAVADCMKPDRIILGTETLQGEQLLRELYGPFNRNHDKIIRMDRRSAELTKYAANSMLASRISLMNELSLIAERFDADIEMVRRGIGSDPRIGYHFIYPGSGYGGSCLPKDVSALIHLAREVDIDPLILRAVQERNEQQKTLLFRKIKQHFGADLSGMTFALWGLSFKPNTDDMREAPSRVLMESLWKEGAKVQATDPQAMAECRSLYGDRSDLSLHTDLYGALEQADALIVNTEWRTFQAPDFARIRATLRYPIVFDGRNVFDPAAVEAAGLAYFGVGRRRPARTAVL